MRERFVESRGLPLCLCQWGPQGGPLVLILHGFLEQGAAWQLVAEPLAQAGCRIVAPDARGMGRSGHVGPGCTYHFPDYVTDVDAIVRALDPPPFVLVGHSLGGTAASLYAAARPERLCALVLVDGLGPPALSRSEAAGRLRLHLDQMADPPAPRRLADLDEAVARMQRRTPALPEALARQLAGRLTVADGDGLRWRWDPLHVTRSPIPFDREAHLARLAAITVPTTLIFGTGGWYYRALEDLDRRREAMGSVVRCEEIPAGHALHIEAPERLAAIIREVAQGGSEGVTEARP